MTSLDPADFFHTGVAVPDLTAAMQGFSDALNITWTAVQSFRLDVRMGNTDARLSSRFVYSTSGPPFLELVEAIPDTPWAAPGAPQLHHLGYWADDLAAAVADLERDGGVVEAFDVGTHSDMNIFAFVRCMGVRVELINGARRQALLEMIQGTGDPHREGARA